jgi:hypothetical protein
LELVEGPVEGTLQGIKSALDHQEGSGGEGLFGVSGRELGFGAAVAADLPVGVDDGVDEEALEGIRGLELLNVQCGEGGEIDGILGGSGGGRRPGSVKSGHGFPTKRVARRRVGAVGRRETSC